MIPTRVVGLGSPHGDDQVGWIVVRRLRALLAGESLPAELCIALSPADLPDLLRSEDRLALVDACQGLGSPGEVRCLDWPDTRIQSVRHAVGHSVSLSDALELAKLLGNAPAECGVWCIEGAAFDAGAPLTPRVAQAAEQLALTLAAAIRSRPHSHA